MARFVAVPLDWTAAQAEAYQAEKRAEGYTRGLSSSILQSLGEQPLPFTWEEDSVADQPPQAEEA